ncbi:hypothetical protein BJQ94_13835 [Cryobacterium sp. SO2]|uniref:hypothetical protein n=1 Tax=Cryobacterium sp. SO2 TaxID=1897060 RepID=UPI00223E075C|nr:hypothetical protein [Cryobacterium sp. SO2]WEO76439.1 hypothetical protein BJQ94_13835 [Cryobacterium sp. SO2]
MAPNRTVAVFGPGSARPAGNRSQLVRDPDGTQVNPFTPVTPAAIARFAPVTG